MATLSQKVEVEKRVEVEKVEKRVEVERVEKRVEAEKIEEKKEVKAKVVKPRASIFNLKAELEEQSEKESATEGEESEVRVIDRSAAEKLEAKRAAIIEYIGVNRPRFKPLFEAMQIEVAEGGEAMIVVEVATAQLESEVRMMETELMQGVVQVAGVEGYVGLKVVVNEVVVAVRPIKLEDKIAHFTTKYPLTVELTNALDLQADS